MPPRGASRAAPKAVRAAPKPHKASKSAAAVPAPPDPADHVPLDLPVTPPPRPQARGGRLCFETPGEDFPPVSPSSSDSELGVAVTEDVFAAPAVPVLISPIKRRQRQAAPTINRLSDLEVWGISDGEILGKYIFYQCY